MTCRHAVCMAAKARNHVERTSQARSPEGSIFPTENYEESSGKVDRLSRHQDTSPGADTRVGTVGPAGTLPDCDCDARENIRRTKSRTSSHACGTETDELSVWNPDGRSGRNVLQSRSENAECYCPSIGGECSGSLNCTCSLPTAVGSIPQQTNKCCGGSTVDSLITEVSLNSQQVERFPADKNTTPGSVEYEYTCGKSKKDDDGRTTAGTSLLDSCAHVGLECDLGEERFGQVKVNLVDNVTLSSIAPDASGKLDDVCLKSKDTNDAMSSCSTECVIPAPSEFDEVPDEQDRLENHDLDLDLHVAAALRPKPPGSGSSDNDTNSADQDLVLTVPSSASSEDSGYTSPSGSVTPEKHRTDAVAVTENTLQVKPVGLMDLFGVQLEVTNRLLDAERRKLAALQRELQLEESCHGYSQTVNEVKRLRINISHIQQQYDQFEAEYEEACRGLLKKTSKVRKSCRSQPAVGLKLMPKTRPSIFGTVAQEPAVTERSHRCTVGAPQMHSTPYQTVMAVANGYLENGIKDIDEKKALVYKDGDLQAGSLEALIQHLVPTAQYRPDRTYMFAFLLSSRLFIRPHQLLSQVCQTCIYQQNLMAETVSRESLGKFGPHMIQLLGEWTDNFPYDYQDERMMRCLKDITQRLVALYPELRKDVGLLMHNLFTKLSGLQKYDELLTRINAEVAQRLLNIMPTTDIYEVSPSPLVLAQQLTHIELERLSMIGPEEFVQAFCKDGDKDVTMKDVKKTNNLESYVQWFNRLSFFVATEICMHLKKKNRVRLIEYFTDVAKECINIGNFNSLMAIIAGLNMNPIQRLKKTWEKVNKEKFEILEHQMNPTSNFGSYRSCLKAALWRSAGASEEREKIVIPFFSLFVKDMYFLNEGCSNRRESGQINFDKFWQLAKQISEFITWKQVECPFDRHPPVLNYLLTNPVFSENSLSLASFECESPENSYEKQRYKQLKEQAGL